MIKAWTSIVVKEVVRSGHLLDVFKVELTKFPDRWEKKRWWWNQSLTWASGGIGLPFIEMKETKREEGLVGNWEELSCTHVRFDMPIRHSVVGCLNLELLLITRFTVWLWRVRYEAVCGMRLLKERKLRKWEART